MVKAKMHFVAKKQKEKLYLRFLLLQYLFNSVLHVLHSLLLPDIYTSTDLHAIN